MTRVIYTITLGLPMEGLPPAVIDDARTDLDACLTRITGGLTRYDGHGTWTTGSSVGDYSGPIERNQAITYVITLLPEEEAQKFAEIRSAVITCVRRHALPIEWVHVSRSIAEERIFRIERGALESRGAEEAALHRLD